MQNKINFKHVNVRTTENSYSLDFIFRKKGMSVQSLDFVSISDEQEGKGMCVLDVTENGEPVNFKYGSDTLEVYLATSDENNEHKQVIITYKGIPATGLIIAPNKHGDRTFFSRNWPNLGRNWLPLVDHPYDKATCEFIVYAPDHYQVVSNGLLMEESTVGKGVRRTHWKQSVPIPVW